MLEFWLAASGAEVSMRTCEQTECAGSLSAIDAEQAHLVVDGLATPMGVYPCAMVRTGDLLYATVGGQWHLPAPLPARPRWVDDADACDCDGDYYYAYDYYRSHNHHCDTGDGDCSVHGFDCYTAHCGYGMHAVTTHDGDYAYDDYDDAISNF